jgi:hypothetical protein
VAKGLAPVACSDRDCDYDDSMTRGNRVPISVYLAKNLKDDKKYDSGAETHDPWDKFSPTEVSDHYYAVAVGKDSNSFGVYTNITKFLK